MSLGCVRPYLLTFRSLTGGRIGPAFPRLHASYFLSEAATGTSSASAANPSFLSLFDVTENNQFFVTQAERVRQTGSSQLPLRNGTGLQVQCGQVAGTLTHHTLTPGLPSSPSSCLALSPRARGTPVKIQFRRLHHLPESYLHLPSVNLTGDGGAAGALYMHGIHKL